MSSNTTSDLRWLASLSDGTTIRSSRSRKKHGLCPLIQNTLSKPKIDSAYSQTSDVLPNPWGATTKRATARSSIIFLIRRGREWMQGRPSPFGLRPQHAECDMKFLMFNPSLMKRGVKNASPGFDPTNHQGISL